MNVIETPIKGLLIIETVNFQDNRGCFQKLFNSNYFQDNNLETNFKEFYYSVSSKNVIRGMHFQLPPYDHVKLVYVSKGHIKDVVVDLRKSSDTFLQPFSIEINDTEGKYLYIPKGLAHGFLSLEDGSIVNYAQTSCYSEEHDCGVAYNSINFDWKIKTPILSVRDLSFKKLEDFNSPF